MANGGFGQFAGSFAEALTRTVGQAQDRKDRDELAKQQAKLVEIALKNQQVQLNAQTTLADLMTGTVEEFQPAEPKFTPAAPPELADSFGGREIPQFTNASQEPLDLAGVLSDPEGQLAALQSGLFSGRDFLGGGGEPSTSKLLKAAGIFPGTQEFKDAILSSIDAGEDADAATQLALSLQEERVREKKAERIQLERTEKESRIGRSQAVRNDFGSAKRIIELQQDLEGTALAAGIPFGDFLRTIGAGSAAVMGIVGFDVRKAQDLIDKRDELAKLFADNTIEALDRFKDTGAITNPKFEALIKASPEIGKTAIANAKVLAGRMRAVLDAAERKGEDVPNRKEIETWISDMKKLSRGITEGVVDVPGLAKDFANMTKEQFEKIPREQIIQVVSQMSAETRAKFLKHIQSLKEAQ